MKLSLKALSSTAEALLNSEARAATKVLATNEVVRVSRVRYRKRFRAGQLTVTYGSPNYAARKFIKLCKKAGEPFPVKKIQLQFARAT